MITQSGQSVAIGAEAVGATLMQKARMGTEMTLVEMMAQSIPLGTAFWALAALVVAMVAARRVMAGAPAPVPNKPAQSPHREPAMDQDYQRAA
jgi:hypothetical protein